MAPIFDAACAPDMTGCCGTSIRHVALGGDLAFGGQDLPEAARSPEGVKPPEVLLTESESEADWASQDWASQDFSQDSHEECNSHEDYSTIVAKCSSFVGSRDLQRGMPLSAALAGFGRIFSSSSGSAETFDLSEMVDHLDYFISHNWSTGRFSKFMALAYHFNSPLALAVAVVGMCLAFFIGCDLDEMDQGDISLGGLLLYMLVLVSARNHRSHAFLDKTCICQTDPFLQRKGIEHLSAFLCCSTEMVVIYTDTYLSKLWTVYELASMIILQPSARITVIPASFVADLCKLILFGLLPSKIIWVVASRTLPEEDWLLFQTGYFAVDGLTFAIAIAMMRRMARERSAIELKVRQFKIREASCAVESDRQVVYRNVAAMMRAKGHVSTESDESTCLDAFDRMVTEVVPFHLLKSVGRAGAHWRFTATMSLLIMKPDQGDSTAAKDIAYSVVTCAATAFTYIPISLDVLLWLLARRLDLRGFRELAWVAALSLLALALGVAATLMHEALEYYVLPDPDMGWIAVAAPLCVAPAFTIAFYRPSCGRGRLLKGGSGVPAP